MPVQSVNLLGIPYDLNSSFQRGPALAPNTIRKALFGSSLNKGTENGQSIAPDNPHWQDSGDLNISESDDFVAVIEQRVQQSLAQGQRLLTLGGDHSISYPLVKAYAKHFDQLTVVHIDAHSDLYDEFKGNRLSNACPFARIMELDLVDSLHQYGIRTLNQHQLEQAEKFGVQMTQMHQWRAGMLPDISGAVYLSIDVDGIDPAFAPGVSHREPGGLSSREVINFIHHLPGELVGCDLVELNPLNDIDNLTANLCGKLVKELAGKMLASIH